MNQSLLKFSFVPGQTLLERSDRTPEPFTDWPGVVTISAGEKSVDAEGVFGFARSMMTAAIRLQWFPKPRDRMMFDLEDQDEVEVWIRSLDDTVTLAAFKVFTIECPKTVFIHAAVSFYTEMAELISSKGGRPYEAFNFEFIRCDY